MDNYTQELMYGLKPVHREDPQAGQSEWYYLDPRGASTFSDMKQIDVESELSPNPYADVNNSTEIHLRHSKHIRKR